VEDAAIAAVSRPSVRDVDRSSIGADRGGKELAILRPGVLGLTIHRAPPVVPPVAIPGRPSPRRFGRATARDVDRLSGGGYGGAANAMAWNGVGGPLPITPHPRARAGDPTPNTQRQSPNP